MRRILSLALVGVLIAQAAVGISGLQNGKVVAGFDSADCTAETGGQKGEICVDTDGWLCVPSAGECDTPGEWKRMAAGVTVKKGGSTVCDLAGAVDLSSLFSVSTPDGGATCLIGPGVGFVITADGTIQKVDLPSAISYEDEANVFTAHQTIRPSLLIEQSGGTDIFDVGNIQANSARYFGLYANADDIATKGDVDAVKGGIPLMGSWTAASMSVAATKRIFVFDTPGTGFGSWIRAPVPKGCTVNRLCASRYANAIPAGNTLEVRLRKNNSTSGEIGCDITAGNNECCLSSGTLEFAEPSGNDHDDYNFSAQCVNAGSDCTDATAQMLRVVAFCEFQ